MESVAPTSWLNKVLLLLSIVSAFLCLVIQEWANITPLPIYVSISWALFVTVLSIWLSFRLLRLTLKRNAPVDLEFVNKWLYKRLRQYITLDSYTTKNKPKRTNHQLNNEGSKDVPREHSKQKDTLSQKEMLNINSMMKEINLKCIETWYKNISVDKAFPNETQMLLRKLLIRLLKKAASMDKIKLANKLADVILLHLKEYRRALRRVEKGTCTNIEEAYRSNHPGSRSLPTLEYMSHRLVTLLAEEFLQWELTSSLPCKLLLSVLAKRLLVMVQTISCPNWMFENLLKLLQTSSKDFSINKSQLKNDGVVSIGLSDGMASATATVIPRPLSQSTFSSTPSTEIKNSMPSKNKLEKSSFRLEGLPVEPKGLWGNINITEVDCEVDGDKISPIYEEPTDFATTIARLRNLLQQKSTATTPLRAEEKCYAICDGNQFMNLCIPWTEFHTTIDGSQQLLYCIQFDDVEQRGMDLFETTTATVKRRYSDFVQLHNSLEEIPSIARSMSNLVLPEGGRVEMEGYLRNLCTRLVNEYPPQLRHFLRPSSSAGKKADIVAPRLDRFLAKTVTGVFNTLKTVVPGFEVDQDEEVNPLPTLIPLADIPWRFVEDIKSRSLANELQQLVAERIDYCSVDTAYEAVDGIEGSGDSELMAHWWEKVNTPYDEETDELDSKLTLTCAAIDLICEVLTGIGSSNALQQEAVVRWTKLLFGNVTEPIIEKAILCLSDSLSNASFTYSAVQNATTQSAVLAKDKIFQILHERIPYDLKVLFGEEDIEKILKYLLAAYEIKKINLDLNMQLVDVLMSQLLISCKTTHDIPQ